VTLILDSEAAIRRSLAQVGHADGAGACLENVYEWFGGPAWSSIGPGAGQYNWAIKNWLFAQYRHAGDWNPPPGVPVHYGTEVTWRTDPNVPCGDIGLSIGGGRGVFTDGPSGNTEIMSLSARGKEIDRNYLGWSADFLGHPVSGALSYIAEANKPANAPKPKPIVVKPTLLDESDTMILIQNSRSIALLVEDHVVGLDIKDVQAFQAAGIPLVKLTDGGFSKLEALK